MDAMPGDMCSISGIVPVTDPINVVIAVGGSVMLDVNHRIPHVVIASGGSINRVSMFDVSTLIRRLVSTDLQSC